jgi:guanosine-3',5'-bis(diphosphate) 3'-pyrophosphohydrolase
MMNLMEKEKFLATAQAYLPEEQVALVEKAYNFALDAHLGQLRKSGEPYLEHPVGVAMILAELQFDGATLAAALLHDVLEDCGVSVGEIETNFGDEVARLVGGTTKLSKLAKPVYGDTAKRELQVENLRKMLIATAEDLRVIFIKLADRLHNMRTLGVLPRGKRLAIAQETLEIYAPIAHRLGIRSLKWQLEDLAFRYLEPREYHQVARLVASKREQREVFVNEAIQALGEELNKAGVEASVFGRPKHVYSIFRKIGKYASQGKDFGDIHDLFGLRILANSIPDCYKALGMVHSLWHPIPEEFNDFIANPKENGYQSLHTAVIYHGNAMEVQIRTYQMDRVAEFGLAAHWRYKEGEKGGESFKEVAWLPQLVEWRDVFDSKEFLESVKSDMLANRVFVFTPKGEIKELSKGATPLDFAFHVHTDLGYRCVGAKVNGRLVPLNYNLNNADVVEIIAAKKEKEPSLDWLNPGLGYVKTSHGRAKIRQWFNRQDRVQTIEAGKQFLGRELKRADIVFPSVGEVTSLFGFKNMDDFFAAIGSGNLSPSQIIAKLAVSEERPEELVEVRPSKKISPASIRVLGVGDLVTHLANCCHPLPGDKIIGYITQGRGVTVHRRDCPNIVNEVERERLIEVGWGGVEQVYPVAIQVNAWDRVGLVRDISVIIAEEGVNITDLYAADHEDIVSLNFSLEVKGTAQLASLISKIYSVGGIVNVRRKGEVNAAD